MLKLGTIVTDNVTETDGMLVIYSIDMDKNQHYLFQPTALDPETRQPLDTFWITERRIVGGEKTHTKLPLNILGSEVQDKATGFIGTAITMFYHINGCLHLEVKPKGVIEKTGQTIKAHEFDIRRMRGKEIKELNDQELEVSIVDNPSPQSHPKLPHQH